MTANRRRDVRPRLKNNRAAGLLEAEPVIVDPAAELLRVRSLINDAVLVKLHAPPEKTSSGLWIPECAEQNKPGYEGALAHRLRLGTVISVGPGKRDPKGRRHPVECVAGDVISFYYFAEYEWLIWPTEGYALLPERFVQSVIGKDGVVRPLHDRVVIERITEVENMRGGIHIPDAAKEKPQEGEVIAVGTGKRLDTGEVIPCEVKAGDRVLCGRFSGTEVQMDGKPLMIMREEEILAVLTRKPVLVH